MHFSELSQASQDCIINTFLDGGPGCDVTPEMKEEIREWAMTDDTVETYEFRQILSHSNDKVMAHPLARASDEHGVELEYRCEHRKQRG